jgi:predicted aspartyl protease
MKSPHAALASIVALLGLACGACMSLAAGSVPAPVESAPAQAVELPPEETLFATPTRKDRIGRVLAPIEINGQAPFRFVLDTGANRSAVSSRVVTALGLDPTLADSIGVHGVTGTADMPAVALETLGAGGVVLRDVRAPILPDTVFAGADGILGIDGLQDARIEVDFANDRVQISRSTGRRAPSGYVTVPARLEQGGLLLVAGRIGREEVQVIIDTGAERTLGNLPLRDALLKKRGSQDVVETTVLGATPDQAIGVTFPSPMVSIGPVQLRNLMVTFGDMHVFEIWGLTQEPALLIGMDLIGTLERFIVDYGRREFQLKTYAPRRAVVRNCSSNECGTRLRRHQ